MSVMAPLYRNPNIPRRFFFLSFSLFSVTVRAFACVRARPLLYQCDCFQVNIFFYSVTAFISCAYARP